MKKIILSFTVISAILLTSCNNKQNEEKDNQIENSQNETTEVEQENDETFSNLKRIFANSERFEYTRVLVCKDNFDEIYLRPDLPIVLDGKFDSSKNIFIEIDREKFESPYKLADQKLIVENKNTWLDVDKSYNYDIYIKENYVLFLDNSIQPHEGKSGISSCKRAGFILYTKGYSDNFEYYNNLIRNEFKH